MERNIEKCTGFGGIPPLGCFERLAGCVRYVTMVQPFRSLGRVVRIGLTVHRMAGIVACMESDMVASNTK